MATMWDDRKPPEPDLIADCVHCGFCLPTCPTYSAVGRGDGLAARAHRQLMGPATRRGRRSPTRSSCTSTTAWAAWRASPRARRACSTASSSRTPAQQVERQRHAPAAASGCVAPAIFALFPHPGRLRALAPMLVAQRRLGLTKYAAKLPKVGTLAGLAPDGPCAQALKRAARRSRGEGRDARDRRLPPGLRPAGVLRRRQPGDARRARGRGLRGPRAARAALLRRAAAAHGRGRARRWRSRRRRSTAFERFDVVVTNAAGCGSAMKDYAHALREDPAWAERAEAFSAKVRDISELLAEHEPRRRAPPGRAGPRRLPRRLPPRPRPGHARPAARAAARDPRPGGRRARRLGDLLRLGRRVQPAEPRARRRAGAAQGGEPARDRRGGDRRGQPRLRAADQPVATEQGEPLRILHPIEVLAASMTERSLTAS